MDVKPCGDTAVLLDLDEGDAQSTLAAVMNVHRQIHQLRLPGVIDIVPAAATVLITLDTALLTPQDAVRVFGELRVEGVSETRGTEVVIPVRYDGPDLATVAEATGLSVRGVVDKHSETQWLAAFGGFAPGFVYLVPARELWNVPRRSQPRAQIPTGAVGLAGEFSGVYPQSSPGGWQIIGTTQTPMWDVNRAQPSLIQPGDTVRFEATNA
ncbi:allophanate hydrolase subunit 1 [Corynebacterium canis]|uniref:Allophanate hydrolase subunit 1 n=1 Tax=Corynebacterium canis TaxID=679663 RepID=A0A5C5UAX3_9CORY|nr:allophanate hydrolase subunit 1 [Corynebacterium canis]TWT23043.1 allophanate hydrolase subunit 1 [Corynebacterium canis]WJY74790.1 Kinase A inhibitor [Corynebacterium canis]